MTWPCLTARAFARDLTFEERIKAQEAIERVYYAHQAGATKRFEEAVTRPLLERKVSTYLKQTVALETLWHVPITADALQHELRRVRQSTRAPERLEEIFQALGHDDVLIQECFVRPVLVDRLARAFLRSDERFQGAAKSQVDKLRRALLRNPRATPDQGIEMQVVDVILRGGRAGKGEEHAPEWDMEHGALKHRVQGSEFERLRSRAPGKAGEVGPVVEGPESFDVQVLLEASQDSFRVAAYSIKKVSWGEWWADASPRFNDLAVRAVARPADFQAIQAPMAPESGSTNCVADDTWVSDGLADPTANRPQGRSGHSAVWTGNRMIVWGGSGDFAPLSSGASFDPVTSTWTEMTTLDAPSPRTAHVGVWTGSLMVVWGGVTGDDHRMTGGRYDPLADAWSPTSVAGSPFWNVYRVGASAVWTGTEMIVWGGRDTGEISYGGGGRYDPAQDTWAPVSPAGAPTARAYHSSVWTGSAMLVWGGFARPFGFGPDTWYADGYAYSPASDSWTPLSGVGAPSPRENHAAIWTGLNMLIWGGDGPDSVLGDGAAYDSANDSWATIPADGAPPPTATAGLFERAAAAVWADPVMIVWGHDNLGSGIGGRFDTIARTWKPVTTDGAPPTPSGFTSVWTGAEMIVWGGGGLDTGGAYRIDQSPDADLDGFTVCAGDCDDSNSRVHPGAAELCNGHDDNCDGRIDEGFALGASCVSPVDACHQKVGTQVCDAAGTGTQCDGVVVFHDPDAPTITVAPSPAVLWPPNHRMVGVTMSVAASDLCSQPVVSLESVTSSEPADTAGPLDGDTSVDVGASDLGSADFSVDLRAERDGAGAGRVYQVTYSAVDASGNRSVGSASILVPHDQGGVSEPLLLWLENGEAGTRLKWDAVPGASSYQVVRGSVGSLGEAGDNIDLGTVTCILPDSSATSTQGHEDADNPAPGEAFFYVAAYNDGSDSGFGTETAPKPRIMTGGGCGVAVGLNPAPVQADRKNRESRRH